MAQNRSAAVMQQRAEPHDSLDYFPTPPWATRALCEQILGSHAALSDLVAWEPACGELHMARPLGEYFGAVYASDVHDYGGHALRDFLFPGPPPFAADWIISNPPFNLGLDFALKAIELARIGVAFLVRSAFCEGGERFRELFKPHPPAVVAQFVERVPMHKGKLTATGSTATSYCWIVWRRDHAGPTEFRWIAPCRARLEHASDYPTPAIAAPLVDALPGF